MVNSSIGTTDGPYLSSVSFPFGTTGSESAPLSSGGPYLSAVSFPFGTTGSESSGASLFNIMSFMVNSSIGTTRGPYLSSVSFPFDITGSESALLSSGASYLGSFSCPDGSELSKPLTTLSNSCRYLFTVSSVVNPIAV